MGSAEESLLRAEKRARRQDVAEDRLSDLPDCLLPDILSRLLSPQAVQTSTLSRRWRHVWRSVPCVNIDQRQFPGSHVVGSRQCACFEDFADGMLATAPAPLDAFRLYLVDGRTASSERWLRRGFGRRPATVDIRCNLAHDRSFVEWPPRNDNLGANGTRLTTLTLSGVTLRSGFAEQLGVLCPVLHELCIDRCQYHLSSCTIASLTLKHLAVVCKMGFSTLAIAAPRLASLMLVVPFSSTHGNPVITAQGQQPLSSLVKASICIDDRGGPNERANKTKLEFLRSLCGLLARLSSVRNLQLSGFTTTALLDQQSQQFPVFQDLTTLLLRCCDVGAINFQVLLRILDSTPSLEKIGLHHCKFSGRLTGSKKKTDQLQRTSPKQRVKTLDQHKRLSSIEIKYQPADQAQWNKFFRKCSKKKQLWRIVGKSYNVVPSTCVNMGRREVSNVGHITQVLEMTLRLGRLHISMCDPKEGCNGPVERRVTKVDSPPTRTNNQIAPRLNQTEDDALNTKGEVMRLLHFLYSM